MAVPFDLLFGDVEGFHDLGRAGAIDLAPLPVQQRLVWQDGAPRRGRAKTTASDAIAADLAAKAPKST